MKLQLSIFLFILTLNFLNGCSSKTKKPDSIDAAKAQSEGHTANQATTHDFISLRMLTRDQAAIRSKQVFSPSYVVWLGLDANHSDFQARVVVLFNLREKADTFSKKLFLDFEVPLAANTPNSHDTSQLISSLKLNERDLLKLPTDFEKRFDGHKIWFDVSEMTPGQNRIELAYRLPYSATSAGLRRYQDPDDSKIYLSSDFQPYFAHSVFPCFDQPDLKASFELTAEVPEDWVVISNTIERDQAKVDGRVSWSFPLTPLISTYTFAIHAGQYHSWKADADGIALRLFSRQSLAKYVDAAEWFKITEKGLDYFSTQFGYPYPYSKYDQVIVPELSSSAMENAAALTFDEQTIFTDTPSSDEKLRRENTILHEMAHMWFGNLVTMRWWNGLWLNESLATWAASWAQANAFDRTEAWELFYVDSKIPAIESDLKSTTHPVEVSIPNTDVALSRFDDITYGKGASLIRTLTSRTGEDEFKEGLQRYLKAFAHRSATVSDFFAKMAEGSSLKLKDWEKAWLHSTGLPKIAVEWSCQGPSSSPKSSPKSSPNSVIDHLTLTQLTTPPRPLNVKIALLHPKQTETIDVELNGKSVSIEKIVNKKCPEAVIINWDDSLYAEVEYSAEQFSWLLKHSDSISNPLARLAIWHTIYGGLVSGRLKIESFLDQVLSHLAIEQNSRTTEFLLDHIYAPELSTSAAINLLSTEKRPHYIEKFEKLGLEKINSKHLSLGLKKLWLSFFLSIQSSPSKHQALIAAWLSGKQKIPELKIELDQTWELTLTLARIEMSKVESLFASMKQKDRTEQVDLYLNRFWLSYRDSAFKFAAIEAFLKPENKPHRSHDMLKFKNLYPANSQAFAENYRSRFLTDFQTLLVSETDEEILAEFVSLVAPPVCQENWVQELRRFSADHSASLPATANRNLLALADQLETCLQIRSHQ